MIDTTRLEPRATVARPRDLRLPVTMQINTYPLDLPHFPVSLAHQLRTFAGQVDRVIVSVDVRPPQSGRYKGDTKGERFVRSLEAMRALYPVFEMQHNNLSFVEVDYSPAAKADVAGYFFGRDDIPDKAWDGGPFYCYFHGLRAAGPGYVLHMDADMLFGGQSQAWIAEAVDLLRQREDLLFVSPLAGPPHPEGLKGAHANATHAYRRETVDGRPAWRFNSVSTRIFLMDMARFESRIGHLALERPSKSQRLRAFLLGNPPQALSAEMVLSNTLKAHGMGNMHFLGSAEGMYSLHPPFHFEAFHKALPDLVARIERGEIPEGQRGDYDLNPSMVDLTPGLANHVWHRRARRRLSDVAAYWRTRFFG
ncbi:capsular biosynthesis protein [Zhengella mangrovi]|uniref:Capsular biosynthesis protein n=1 Tax=Zhengella mangrovi TaxID=1982044 RepID=A0A2G1QHX7_9HYPH|nr:capsular biosynthesis protein [Zhengella mangrovi]PHP65122.1 capsular biosynthesis protein [Zhengella mangrovi]